MTHKILYKVRYDIIKYNGRRFHDLGGINIAFPEYRNFASETQFRGKYSAEMGPARKKRRRNGEENSIIPKVLRSFAGNWFRKKARKSRMYGVEARETRSSESLVSLGWRAWKNSYIP